ncbi:dna-binding protein smubp-2 [Stylonychia lemnae]|uniref:DNA helicase n=1 Tax=Stylonychia lemnae TaxID=5949 RepID=A0A078A5U9_STYLE|nr:dna-binding protein smubp-2 [Stylonychia lemnae]|eukprot:CDW76925.1 dna-binding protein smubp-2 [Stylonychia lemnae]
MESVIYNFTEKMSGLLQMERQAELDESASLLSKFSLKELEKRNLAITKLSIKDVSTGIYGKILLHLSRPQRKVAKEYDDGESKITKFSPGDIVGLFQAQSTEGSDRIDGIVYKVNEDQIVVSFREMHDFESLRQPLSLVILANEITHKRCKEALETIRTRQNQRLIEVLFEIQEPQVQDDIEYLQNLTYYNQGLNTSQRLAIEKCLSSTDVSLIHGPPGTGKTTTVVELILQAVDKQKAKILACAPSNIAVDNIIERLSVSNPNLFIVRIGHPARLMDSVQQFCLDALISSRAEYGKQTNEIRKLINKLNQKLQKSKSKQERKEIYGEYKQLKKDLKQIEQRHINDIFTRADVICCTLTSAADKTLSRFIENKMQDQLFDMLVIDECAQSVEPACWIPIKNAKKLVMAGDHKQLDATVKSDEASKKGLSLSLFERVMKFKNKNQTMLNEQYRMNEKIMSWSNQAMYDGNLKAHIDVKDRLMVDLYQNNTEEIINNPLLFIDTAGALIECDLVIQVLKELISLGIKKSDIGVITPYNAQVNMIKKAIRFQEELHTHVDRAKIGDRIEVSTVDGFQGREKEVIIISMVRSNPKGEIGFLSNERRMNVAVTRAKRLCTIIADSGTVSKNSFLKALIQYFKDNAIIRSAFDYQGNSDVRIMYGQYQSQGIDEQTLIKRNEQRAIQGDTKQGLSQAEKNKLKKERKKQKKQGEDQNKDQNQEEEKGGDQGRYKFQKANQRDNMTQDEKDQQDQIREQELHAIIDDFFSEPNVVAYNFPSTLNGWERQVVHAYCEILSLGHESKGNGMSRYITISKGKQVAEEQKQQEQKPKSLKEALNQHKVINTQSQAEPQDIQQIQQQNLTQNSQLSEYLQKRKQQEEQKSQQQTQQQEVKKEEKKKEKKKKSKASKQVDQTSGKAEQMDDLDFLDSIISLNKQCHYHVCRVSIELFYCTCKYCKNRFCADHFQPEKHLCEKDYEASLTNNNAFKSQNNQVLKDRAEAARKELEAKRQAKPTKKQAEQTTTSGKAKKK